MQPLIREQLKAADISRAFGTSPARLSTRLLSSLVASASA
jgi:hypothetical protein